MSTILSCLQFYPVAWEGLPWLSKVQYNAAYAVGIMVYQQLFVQQLVQASNTAKQNITGSSGGESIMVIMVYAGMTQLN